MFVVRICCVCAVASYEALLYASNLYEGRPNTYPPPPFIRVDYIVAAGGRRCGSACPQ